jgi:hypothetical protein
LRRYIGTEFLRFQFAQGFRKKIKLYFIDGKCRKVTVTVPNDFALI